MTELANQPSIGGRDSIQLSHGLRLRGNSKRIASELIINRDGSGNSCGHEGESTIDHKDARLFLCACGNVHPDHSLQNLRHICFICNSKKGGPRQTSNLKDRERNTDAEVRAKNDDAYSNQVAYKKQRPFRRLAIARVLASMRTKAFYTLDKMVSQLSEEMGIAISTAYKYMAKLLEGPFDILLEKNTGMEYIILRYDEYKFLSVDEIEELHPVKGRMYVDPTREKEILALAEERARASIKGTLVYDQNGEHSL